MTDLVEEVARAIYEEDDPWHKAWPWPDLQSDQAGVDQYRRIARAAIAVVIERCAKVAESVQSYDDALQKSAGCLTSGQRIAAAIRKLGESE